MIKVAAEQLTLNQRELKARLGGAPAQVAADIICECQKELFAVLNCAYHYRLTTVKTNGDSCDLGFGEITSHSLRRNLEGCNQAYVFAATLGFAADRLLKAAALQSTLKHFVTDALASTAIEALCDYAQAALPLPTKPRFSAGYGDFALEHQQQLLNFINAQKELGIVLSKSCLMTPTKSVTAIIGIK